MSGCVLDSSLALSWVLPDESPARFEELLRKTSSERPLWVPAIWWQEIVNALLTAERRGRLAEAAVLQAVEFYHGLPLETDFAIGQEVSLRRLALGREHGLTSYDAAYLELAARRQLSLASLDRALIQAAKRAGIKIRD